VLIRFTKILLLPRRCRFDTPLIMLLLYATITPLSPRHAVAAADMSRCLITILLR